MTTDHLSCTGPACSSGEFWLKPDGRIVCADDECYAPNGTWTRDPDLFLASRADARAVVRLARMSKHQAEDPATDRLAAAAGEGMVLVADQPAMDYVQQQWRSTFAHLIEDPAAGEGEQP